MMATHVCLNLNWCLGNLMRDQEGHPTSRDDISVGFEPSTTASISNHLQHLFKNIDQNPYVKHAFTKDVEHPNHEDFTL
jgi:hypothetical protein